MKQLALCALALTSVACSAELERNSTEEAPLVAASGTLTPVQGTLAVSVSPQDSEGNFVGQELPQSAFSFRDVTIGLVDGLETIEAKTEVTNITVSQPQADEAFTVVVVFDSSGSMSENDPNQEGRKEAGLALFEAVDDGDNVAVLDFGAGSSDDLAVSRLLQDFTDSREDLIASLDLLSDSGSTPLWESMGDALDLLDSKQEKDGVIVLLTDGVASDVSDFEHVIERAAERSTEVYTVGLGDSLDFERLALVGVETGGGSVRAADAEQLQRTFRGITAGVSVGRVTVEGMSTYSELPPGTLFEVSGELVTDDPLGEQIITPFVFVTPVTEN